MAPQGEPKAPFDCAKPFQLLREARPGGFTKPGGFPLLSGKVQIASRTLSRLFLVGAFDRPGERKRTNRGNPWSIPEQIEKIPEKSGKSQKGPKKEGQVQIGKPPRLKPPRLVALEIAPVLLTVLIVGVRADPPRKAKIRGLGQN